jgi:signal transduction histidine kinase
MRSGLTHAILDIDGRVVRPYETRVETRVNGARWTGWVGRLSLAQRFLIGSLVILAAGMTGIGLWVSRQIEDGIVHRTASTTALYVDSLIAGPLQGMATDDGLSAEAFDRLNWLMEDTPLGRQVAVFRVWDLSGRIVYSTDPSMVGQQFPVEGDLAESINGEVTADVGSIEGEVNLAPGLHRHDLLEIYSPIRGSGTDQVIAVAEFYYGTEDIQSDISEARRQSWFVVGGVTVLIYLVLAVFVQRASNTIVRQQHVLAAQVDRLTDLLHQNDELHRRVQGAAARTTALNERFLRRFAAELHDGPAQDISLALLRLDHVAARTTSTDTSAHASAARDDTANDLDAIQKSLRNALNDVRSASAGLMLPRLAELSPAEVINHAIRAHRRRTHSTVDVEIGDLPTEAPVPTKIALYRIIQEGLTNAWRHAGGQGQSVRARVENESIRLEVIDSGPGFDVATMVGTEDHLGLVGIRERVESLGGSFRIESAHEGGACQVSGTHGTCLIALLPLRSEGEFDV